MKIQKKFFPFWNYMKVRTSGNISSVIDWYQYSNKFTNVVTCKGRRKPMKASRQTELEFDRPFAIADLVLISAGYKSGLTVLIIINKKIKKEYKIAGLRSSLVVSY